MRRGSPLRFPGVKDNSERSPAGRSWLQPLCGLLCTKLLQAAWRNNDLAFRCKKQPKRYKHTVRWLASHPYHSRRLNLSGAHQQAQEGLPRLGLGLEMLVATYSLKKGQSQIRAKPQQRRFWEEQVVIRTRVPKPFGVCHVLVRRHDSTYQSGWRPGMCSQTWVPCQNILQIVLCVSSQTAGGLPRQDSRGPKFRHVSSADVMVERVHRI